ncbi:unnamed protein product [Penicillium salamii]|nr:unnamed protein product [Penicillium salamii]
MQLAMMDRFQVPCEIEKIGSSAQVIRSSLLQLKKIPKLVTAYARFTNVPPDLAKLDFSKGCRQFYNSETRCLIVTVPGRPHEIAAGNFSFELNSVANSLNWIRQFEPYRCARVETTSSAKEPDDSWAPIVLPPNRNDEWPTVVLEVGVSESIEKLHADAAWWLITSQGLVNLVITISIKKTVPQLTFEAIVRSEELDILRNDRHRYQTMIRQSIVVSRPSGDPAQPITCVPNEPLRISSEELLCRPSAPPGADPNIPVDSLKYIASRVWESQRL